MNIPNVTKPRFRNPEALIREGFDLGFGRKNMRLYTRVFAPGRFEILGHFPDLYTHERFFAM